MTADELRKFKEGQIEKLKAQVADLHNRSQVDREVYRQQARDTVNEFFEQNLLPLMQDAIANEVTVVLPSPFAENWDVVFDLLRSKGYRVRTTERRLTIQW